MTATGIPDRLVVEYVPLNQLQEYHRNAHRGNIARIRSSLRDHSQYKPVVVNRGTLTNRVNEVLCGNHTLLAADAERWDELGVVFVDVDDDEAARINLIDNPRAGHEEDLGYDERILLEALAALPSLDGTGYDQGDMTSLEHAIKAMEEAAAAAAGGGEGRKSLAERFGVPPFTLLDARQGYWQDRKRAWTALGMNSELGREGGLLGGFANAKMTDDLYRGRPVTGDQTGWKSGTSIFDPVLCELLIRWYSVPGARVLDPFAGGSVRGLVSYRLGRSYTGIDLSAEQVTANETQLADWDARGLCAPALAGPEPVVGNLTPVEEHGGFLVKRDDAWTRNGASGAKSRVMFALAGGAEGLITAGARRSPQIERAALVAHALGVPCRVHVPAGADTDEIRVCRSVGAEVVKHPAGRLSVLRARFRKDSEANPGWLAVPFGMGVDAYADDVAGQVANLPEGVSRVVVPCGSGMTTAGVLRGLDDYGRSDVPVVAVTVGHAPEEYLDQFAPANWRDRVTLVTAAGDFDDDAPDTMLGGLALDPMYEAKCLPFLEDGDLLWCCGIRSSAVAEDLSAPLPRWVVGDARNIRDLVPVDDRYDLILTCPPYYNLEEYSDDPADLSKCPDYPGFLRDYEACLSAATDRMAQNAFAGIVTGPLRDKAGYVLDLPADTTRIMERLGWRLYQDAVLATAQATAGLRAGRQFASLRKLTRVHQVIGVYHRGDLTAVRAWPPAEVGDPVTGDEPEAIPGETDVP